MRSVLFVCLGNICRSPLAEAILRRDAEAAGVELIVDSAGTGDWHVGQLPDARARKTGQGRGCEMEMRARQLRRADFTEFDLIVVMDRNNLRDVLRWPGADPARVRPATSFDPEGGADAVADPYYGGPEDFEAVADQLERIARGILREIQGQ